MKEMVKNIIFLGITNGIVVALIDLILAYFTFYLYIYLLAIIGNLGNFPIKYSEPVMPDILENTLLIFSGLITLSLIIVVTIKTIRKFRKEPSTLTSFITSLFITLIILVVLSFMSYYR